MSVLTKAFMLSTNSMLPLRSACHETSTVRLTIAESHAPAQQTNPFHLSSLMVVRNVRKFIMLLLLRLQHQLAEDPAALKRSG